MIRRSGIYTSPSVRSGSGRKPSSSPPNNPPRIPVTETRSGPHPDRRPFINGTACLEYEHEGCLGTKSQHFSARVLSWVLLIALILGGIALGQALL